jgi:hypothetical protein
MTQIRVAKWASTYFSASEFHAVAIDPQTLKFHAFCHEVGAGSHLWAANFGMEGLDPPGARFGASASVQAMRKTGFEPMTFGFVAGREFGWDTGSTV